MRFTVFDRAAHQSASSRISDRSAEERTRAAGKVRQRPDQELIESTAIFQAKQGADDRVAAFELDDALNDVVGLP